ncbi:P-type conjugative transfer ATPase TrbB [Prosthecochloris sp. N3]|uniref:P-type conjugative transfer ATPase TrbB n=1 Tax=Prosthecochloris ethylica TaxID=2743976 RepID=A0ABR9XUE5_9CHLB|nr:MULTISPECIES: P-type conjugative transfer ATPase TrbB [Prosthecochloris]MBF0587325.1 P-type conjugative transfer ATPase TrbB [Prosthecochloris ethylica]MBF0637580.1 P-type conjugative transfer ATPase TrbB [Prosthecochloris ethylica]NUK48288.1 P-type conjugative transfer ATPase TrbB [Prosthecochloris ethylica]RNA64498.1 P-type conjugative transfer ATPase TrbB [Prosthecochloris sp. ZM_2]
MDSVSVSRRRASLRSAVEPILCFLEQDGIVEIMLNPDGCVWVEEAGCGMYRTDVRMCPEEAERMIRLAAAAVQAEVNEHNPSLAATLPGWGARLQASVPPVVPAPVFALRKPPSVVFTLDDYVASGILAMDEAHFLEESVRAGRNVLVGGGTGSGKTTLANALLAVVAETGDRVYIVEDTPELQCRAENMVQVLVQPPFYTHQRAVMDAMRFRPDRIIVGEVRDGAALDMLKAWNTGHPGGVATIHANNPEAMLERMAQLTEEVMPSAPRYLIAEAVDVCVHMTRDPGHPAGRRLTGIAEVRGLDGRGGWVMDYKLINHERRCS